MQEKSIKQYEKRTKTPEQALSSLMRLASRAEKSSGDAMRLMRTWGVDEHERPKVLRELIKQGFIDDRRYAHAYVREKSRLNGWGARKIATMLRSKGISKDIIETALSQIDGGAAKDKLLKMMERKAAGTKYENAYQLKGKLLRYGLSLGYDYDDVMAAVEQTVSILVTE